MSDNRWRRIEELFHQAASLAPVQRSEFLARTCADDHELRHQVESLLANDKSKDDLVGAAVARAMEQPVESGDQEDDLVGQRIGPYAITELIGAGGMGRVYAATDSRLGRKVALKLLPNEFTDDPAALERFRREARTLSALNHPHICTIHDIIEQDRRTVIVMEYVEGVSLKGALSPDQALKYAVQICDALDAAHRKGFIHRDLKPANILVTEAGIKLLDFGLARIASGSDDDTLTLGLSQAGVVMGTPAYMAPEQADGQPTDERSDIFSLGAVLYEMLSGRRAFPGDSMARVLSAVVRDDPAPLQAPPALERVVMRCLKKDPAQRFQNIAEVRAALEQIPAGPQPEQPSIAVLPFVNLSADKENEYFSDGLAEEIINVLAKIPGLKVIARTSAFAFRGKEQDITNIAQALGVRTILEGSVRRAGNHIRVTAQLINAADGSHLWSERYDREMTDVLGMQDEIAAAIAVALRTKLAIERNRPAKRDTQDKEAYHLYLRGRYLQNQRSPELMRKGMEYFERAIAKDPFYALPYAGLSDLLCIAGLWGREPPNKIYPRAIAAATKALEIDDSLADAHASLAFARNLHYWDWTGSEEEFKRALDLKPNSPLAHVWYSYHLSMLGRHDQAIEQARCGVDLDPLSTSVNFGAVRAYFYARCYDEAITQGRRGLELGSNDFPTLFQLGQSYMHQGMPDEAIAFCQESVDVSERHPVALGILGHVYGLSGQREQAQKVADELTGLSHRTYVPPATIAFVYLGLQAIDELLPCLEKACLDRSAILPYLVNSPAADRLRSETFFQDLRRRMNLARWEQTAIC